MKKLVYIAAITSGFLFASCGGQSPSSEETATQSAIELGKFEFAIDEYNFGTIIQGEKVSYSFKFKNVGQYPLVISNAKGSCGCTVPSWPKEPVAPGEEGVIDVVFDSTGKGGKQRKSVSLTANTVPTQTNLIIKGEVITPQKDSE